MQCQFNKRKSANWSTLYFVPRTYLFFLLISYFLPTASSFAQLPALDLVKKVKAKLDKVNDYTATGKMKTDVVFIKAPISNIKAYYKKPNKFQVKRDGGISLLPKGGVSINISSLLLTEDYTAIDAGNGTIDNTPVRIIKLLPLNENSDVVLTTMYIDEKALLIRKASTTTKDNGTYDMQMNFGKYTDWGLPDKVIFSFNTKDYKLPKGVTLEYDDGSKKAELPKNKKGKVEITYSSYVINKGVNEDMLK
jgi:outer membrane lipoprotein-sorting protein